MKPEGFAHNAIDFMAKDDERYLRAAAHAAYYSVYHIAAKYFGRDTKNDYDNAKHSEIRQLLRAIPDKTKAPENIWKAKRYINTLWDARVKADYHIDDNLDANEIEALVEASIGISGISR